MPPFDIKFVFAAAGVILNILAIAPYIRDTLRGRTAPHAYTWFIWTVTGIIAGIGTWYGGGGWGVLGYIGGTSLGFFIFLLSIRYGTRNRTRSDTAALIAALAAIFVWMQLDNPLLSILTVSAIDAVGYIPTYRKSYEEPWSETLSTWILFCGCNIFSFLALAEYNVLTTVYLAVILACNVAFVILCTHRRRFVPRPTTASS